jgi:hypothetical protein
MRAAPPPPRVKRPSEAEVHQGIAEGLKRDGYNGAVVARKMIEEHGMTEEAATAMVGKLYGKAVNPRAGDTTSSVMTGALMIGAGLGGALILFLIVGFAFLKLTALVYVALLGLAGTGATKIIISMVNAGAKEDLRHPRDR